MFRIGEFAQIARVSGRLLRYYDEIGLLQPQRIDPQTGYRYYSAGQLPQLNRILALKDLGLSLEEAARLLGGDVSAAEIRGMLLLKKAELERSLSEEAARLRHVESRLRQIEEQGSLEDYDVVLKSAPARPYLALRATFPSMDGAVAMLREVAQAVTRQVAPSLREQLIVVAHSDFAEDGLDFEIGFAVAQPPKRRIVLPSQHELTMRELPAVPKLASLVRSGPEYQAHLASGALGLWMEANGYGVAGPCREVFLDVPSWAPMAEDTTMEIQFPVMRAA